MSFRTASSRRAQVGRQVVDRLREYVSSGAFSRLAQVDPQTGEIVSQEARALFASLPTVAPVTAVDELVEHGLIPSGPQNLHLAYAQPKYRPGRTAFVRTHVQRTSPASHLPVGGFARDEPLGFTHRAVLVAQRGDDFLAEVDSAPDLLAFPKTDIYSWNEPCGVSSSGGRISGVQIDYNEPLWKAHVCAGYLEIADALAELDFSRDDAPQHQVQLIHRVASRIQMAYIGRGEGYSGHRAGPLLSGGQGVCFVQRAVAGAYLQAFAAILGFELQMVVGRTLRLEVPHGFLVVLVRPSLQRYVCDPAWHEPLTDLRVAFFGPRWGHDRYLVGFEGEQDLRVPPSEVDLPEASPQ